MFCVFASKFLRTDLKKMRKLQKTVHDAMTIFKSIYPFGTKHRVIDGWEFCLQKKLPFLGFENIIRLHF